MSKYLDPLQGNVSSSSQLVESPKRIFFDSLPEEIHEHIFSYLGDNTGSILHGISSVNSTCYADFLRRRIKRVFASFFDEVIPLFREIFDAKVFPNLHKRLDRWENESFSLDFQKEEEGSLIKDVITIHHNNKKLPFNTYAAKLQKRICQLFTEELSTSNTPLYVWIREQNPFALRENLDSRLSLPFGRKAFHYYLKQPKNSTYFPSYQFLKKNLLIAPNVGEPYFPNTEGIQLLAHQCRLLEIMESISAHKNTRLSTRFFLSAIRVFIKEGYYGHLKKLVVWALDETNLFTQLSLTNDSIIISSLIKTLLSIKEMVYALKILSYHSDLKPMPSEIFFFVCIQMIQEEQRDEFNAFIKDPQMQDIFIYRFAHILDWKNETIFPNLIAALIEKGWEEELFTIKELPKSFEGRFFKDFGCSYWNKETKTYEIRKVKMDKNFAKTCQNMMEHFSSQAKL